MTGRATPSDAPLRHSSRGSPGASFPATVLAIAATYFYFLIYAEFAFLELVRDVAPAAGTLRVVMSALGLGGILGAVGGAAAFRPARARMLLATAFCACAGSALAALAARSLPLVVLSAAASGLSLGALTVILASLLRQGLGSARLGLGIGLGTGIAYAVCNVPVVFQSAASTQAVMAIVAVAVATLLPRWMRVADPTDNLAAAPAAGAIDRGPVEAASPGAVVRWVLVFLALVWLDSAAFYIVQHTPSLRAGTWGGIVALHANAVIHLAAAVAAGWLLDRGGRRPVAGVALVALATAGLMLGGIVPHWVSANWFYTAGVSLYSVALVEFPARTGRPWVAAAVFATAGWGGSALGIGMAQDLARIPVGFVAAAALVVFVALLGRRSPVAGVAALLLVSVTAVRADEADLGREVYIAEGCIHCHSQYIRPRVASEVLNWGPATPLAQALDAKPPLFGTRRQGPDLSHVGNRRSREWNRLHLIDPRAVSPGSRMPSYAHLFRKGDPRGDALLDYLASLGADTIAQRQQQIAGWTPARTEPVPPKEAARLFNRLCIQCHGESGHGDGRLAGSLSVRPPDWSRMPWRHVGAGDDVDLVLSRIIKFGVQGLPMAGHEYLTDAEILGLARHVESLHKSAESSRPPTATHEDSDRRG